MNTVSDVLFLFRIQRTDLIQIYSIIHEYTPARSSRLLPPAPEPHRPPPPHSSLPFRVCAQIIQCLLTLHGPSPIAAAAAAVALLDALAALTVEHLVVLVLDDRRSGHEGLLVDRNQCEECEELRTRGSMFGSERLPAREEACSQLASCGRWQAVRLEPTVGAGQGKE